MPKLKKNEDNDKNYLPYEGETNYNQFDNKPLVMISSEEKINDLRGIISEQENKSNFYNVMLKKLMNTMNHGKVNLNKLFQQMETFNKINELQKEKEIYKNQVNELNDNISELKEELEDVKNNKIENDYEIIYE